MNILFDYLYRDAGNNKLYGSVIFRGLSNLPIHIMLNEVETYLYQRIYFIPELLGVPRLKFEKYNEDLDHIWHEFDSISKTTRPLMDNRDFSEIINSLKHKPQFLISQEEFEEIEKSLTQ